MKVLLDLNVVLDVILNRQPWVAEARQIWNAHHAGELEAFLAATEFTNMFYIGRVDHPVELVQSMRSIGRWLSAGCAAE
jgi:hypothetical protein